MVGNGCMIIEQYAEIWSKKYVESLIVTFASGVDQIALKTHFKRRGVNFKFETRKFFMIIWSGKLSVTLNSSRTATGV